MVAEFHPSVSEIKSRACIDDVAAALGSKVRGRRCNAPWRDGKHMSVALDIERGLFFDHGAERGGDCIDLVRLALDVSFKEAVAWLASYLGIPVPFFDRAASRDLHRRRAQAQPQAHALTAARHAHIRSLIAQRNRLWDGERMTSAGARVLLSNPNPSNEAAWNYVFAHAFDDERGDEVQREIERIEAMSPVEFEHFALGAAA